MTKVIIVPNKGETIEDKLAEEKALRTLLEYLKEMMETENEQNKAG